MSQSGHTLRAQILARTLSVKDGLSRGDSGDGPVSQLLNKIAHTPTALKTILAKCSLLSGLIGKVPNHLILKCCKLFRMTYRNSLTIFTFYTYRLKMSLVLAIGNNRL